MEDSEVSFELLMQYIKPITAFYTTQLAVQPFCFYRRHQHDPMIPNVTHPKEYVHGYVVSFLHGNMVSFCGWVSQFYLRNSLGELILSIQCM